MHAIGPNGRQAARNVGLPLALCGVGVASYGLSAAFHGTELISRGAVIFVAIAVYLVGFASVTFSNHLASLHLITWLCLSWIAVTVIQGNELTRASFGGLWKYGIATPATILVVALLLFARANKVVIAAVMLAAGMFSLSQNFRSHGIICVFAGFVVLAVGRQRFFPRSRFATLLLVSVALVPVILIPNLIEQGIFGADVQAKMLSQAESPGPLIFAGRTEPPLSFAVIGASPWIGWGSTEKIPSDVIFSGLELTRSLGMTEQDSYLRGWFRNGASTGPALHSALFQAWAEAGIGAAVVFIWLVFVALRAAVARRGWLQPLITLLALQAIWDTLFSPLSAAMLPLWAMMMLLFHIPRSHRANLGSTSQDFSAALQHASPSGAQVPRRRP